VAEIASAMPMPGREDAAAFLLSLAVEAGDQRPPVALARSRTRDTC
jgi:hypothetical protein